MNDSPLFSVLIANYNNGKYLKEAIQSIYSQTYTNWEIIIVDDFSTDNSFEIYEEIKLDTRIHVYVNDMNYGCGYTKRRCVELASGEILGFLDPDDALSEIALSTMVYEHIKNANASLISSGYYYCDKNLNVTHKTSAKPTYIREKTFLENQDGTITAFATFKRSKYQETDGINVFLQRAVDHDLYYRLEEVGEVYLINSYLYFYRQGTGLNISLGANYCKSVLWDFIAMIEACKRRGIAPENTAFDFLIRFIDNEKNMVKDQIRRTLTYRIGYIILNPIRFVIKILKTKD